MRIKACLQAAVNQSVVFSGYELGENLFYGSSPATWTDVINAWHSEVANYQYPNGSADWRTVGHYTQVTVAMVTVMQKDNKDAKLPQRHIKSLQRDIK